MLKNKIAVYTAIFGGYDEVQQPKVLPKGVDFFLFTDQEQVKAGVWNAYKGIRRHKDPRRDARRYKYDGHNLFKGRGYTHYIWADGNMEILKDPRELMKQRMQGVNLLVHRHPGGYQCLYGEASVCKKLRLDKPEVIDKQIKRIRAAGYPKKNGLAETNVLIRDFSPMVEKLNEAVKATVAQESLRDQLIFNFALWKLNVPFKYIEMSSHSNPFFRKVKHKSKQRQY